MKRHVIQTGTNWRGDRVWYVYDNVLRLTVAAYETIDEAKAFVANPRF